MEKDRTFPEGNSLCYEGEKDGHFQKPEESQELPAKGVLFPNPFLAGEIVALEHEEIDGHDNCLHT